jgi:hypothetical protein
MQEAGQADSSRDAGNFVYSNPAPPVGGLGNFKGVMLCSRPTDDSKGAGQGSHIGADGQSAPFKSTVSVTANDHLGINPPKQMPQPSPEAVKTRGPSAALRRHVRWLRDLRDQVREEKQKGEDGVKAEEARVQKMQEAFKQQRDAISRLKKEREEGTLSRQTLETIFLPTNKVGRAGAAAPKGSDTAPKAGAAAPASKPLWAMTEVEKETFEDQEADDLIQFAEDLNFDGYIQDLEFRECLQAVRDRARKLQREQNEFKDSILREFNEDEGEGDAAAGGSPGADRNAATAVRRGRAVDGAPVGDDELHDWDASTACGEERAVDKNLRTAADSVLDGNSKLRAVHSKESVSRLIEKSRADAE